MNVATISEVHIYFFRCSVKHLAAKRGSDTSVKRGIPIKDLSSNCSRCQVTNRFVCLFARISPKLKKKSLCFSLFVKCTLLCQSCTHEVSIFVSLGTDRVPLNYRQV